MDWLEKFKVNVPEGQDGVWSVKKFNVSKRDAEYEQMRASCSSNGGRGVPAGTYTGLYRGDTLIMSDTPDEILDHLDIIRKAAGHCLIGGLGLGMVTKAMLQKPEVTHVTVIELAPEVIRLIGTHLQAEFPDRLTIVEGDILTWKPHKGVKYDTAWFDIWDGICTDNLKEISTLNRRFARCAKVKHSWQEDRLRYELRRLQNSWGW